MKIAFIGHKRIPSREGGVEVVVNELAVRMAAKGHSIDVYNRYKKGYRADKHYAGTRIITVPTVNKKSCDAFIYSVLASLRAIFGRYDCIHYHAEGPSVMLWLPHLFGIRTVATIHGLDWQRSKWGGFATKYLLLGEKIAAKYADEVIVLSENVRDYFKKTYNRDTRYIPNGVEIPDICPANIIKTKYGLENDSYILFLGRLVPEKGVHYLINAFKKIDTDKKLVIAGGASHSSEYERELAELAKTDSRIIMTGFVQGEELGELFSNCYLYVLPSDIEGMPLSLMEAMSYGRFCVTSNIYECTSVTDRYGLSFKKGDADDLKRVLDEALIMPRPEPEDISKSVIERFNWDDVTDRTLKLYMG